MRQSQLITKTRKEVSQQEHSINAQLLERAGYVSKLMAGVFTYLPLGYRVLTKIEHIVRTTMDELGAQGTAHAFAATKGALGDHRSLGRG